MACQPLESGRDSEKMETGNAALLFGEWIFAPVLGSRTRADDATPLLP
jgi:hypothetical protein